MPAPSDAGMGLAALQGRVPLDVAPELSVRCALRQMHRARADCVVVLDTASRRPLGILTLRDVLARVVLADEVLDQVVAGVMTGGVVALPCDADIHQARLRLASHALRHLVLVDGAGRFAGVLARGDLYASRHGRDDDLVERIQAARSPAELAAAAASVREAAAARAEQGEGAEGLGTWIAILNDLIALAAIDLAEADFDLPLVPWCWLAFGSEGRLEQTLATDQDNGLIFAASGEDEADRLRARFLPFAERVNRLLDACGFPLCKGGVMASNPKWCLSEGEWRARFAEWMRAASADDLLNATIFFDFRPLAGDGSLAAALQRWLLGNAADNALFLRFMAINALRGGPPLGRIRDFVVDRGSGLLDLKRDGCRPFVDAARIYALALGLTPTSTAARLRAAGGKLRWDERETRALVDAFGFIQQLRLRQQRTTPRTPNQVSPGALSALDRAFLKESFRQARRLQQKLQTRYQL